MFCIFVAQNITLTRVNFYLTSLEKVVSAIQVVIYHRGQRYRKCIGISCDPKTWNGQICTVPKIGKAIKSIRIGLEYVLDERSTPKEIESALGRIQNGKWCEESCDWDRPTFMEFFREWANRDSGAVRQRRIKSRLP